MEDVALIYPSGRLPNNCFACGLQSNFEKWRRLYLQQPQTKRMKGVKTMSDKKKTYELADENYKVYFDGKVLSQKSSDEEWKHWIEYPVEEEKREERRKLFKKLPAEPKQAKQETEEKAETTEDKPAEQPKRRTRKAK